jgi:3D (Asp-Asp-Asp) domain-containing protein
MTEKHEVVAVIAMFNAIVALVFGIGYYDAKDANSAMKSSNTALIQTVSQDQSKIAELQDQNDGLKTQLDDLKEQNVQLTLDRKVAEQQLAATSKQVSSLVLDATAYTASVKECGKKNGKTAMGGKVIPGATCAISRDLKKRLGGKRIHVEGVGFLEVNDTMAPKKRNAIDIAAPSVKEALAFGKKSLVVTFVDDRRKI